MGMAVKPRPVVPQATGQKQPISLFSPKQVIFYPDKLAIGAELGVSATITNYPGNNPDKSTNAQFQIMPFARYYLISGTGGIFVEGGVGVGFGKRKTIYPTTTQETNLTSFTAGITPGGVLLHYSKTGARSHLRVVWLFIKC